MPDTWVEPELFLFHNGVAIYHCYRNDVLSGGTMEYWYTTDIEEQIPAFDIRDLSCYQTGVDHKTILSTAIEKEELQAPNGARIALTQDVNLLLTFPELDERPEILHFMTAPNVDAAEVCSAFEKALKTARQDKNSDRLTCLDRAISEVERQFVCEASRASFFREVEI